MKRLYFLAPSLESTEGISNDLHNAGVEDYNIHVIGKDEQGLRRRRIHQASPLMKLDVIHSGEIGALFGLFCGYLLAGFLMHELKGIIEFGVVQFTMVMIFVTMFGSWVGGIAGVSHENHKLSYFHDDIEAGKFLVMIDVKKGTEEKVMDVMAAHKEATAEGWGTNWENPFEGLPMLSSEHHPKK